MSPHRPRLRLTRLLASLLGALVVATIALVAGPATSASAASCTYPTFSVYPGSAIPPHVRYAQVSFSFAACSGESPSSWSASVSRQAVNSTGKNLGFVIDGVSIRPVASGSSYKDFDGVISASSCTPRVGWPCRASYTFTVEYRVSLDRYGNPQVYQGARYAPGGMALYTTP